MLQTAIANVSKIGDGVWEAPLGPSDVGALGRPVAQETGMSVILASDISEAADGTAILFPPGGVKVLNRGTASRTIVLARPLSARATKAASGDSTFLAEAAKAGPEVEEFARRMLDEVRKLDPDGDLVSFPQRRFINKPDNFVVLVPQPQIRQLKVIVRGNPGEFQEPPSDLKKDQHGYSTFKVRNATDLRRAIELLQQIRRKH